MSQLPSAATVISIDCFPPKNNHSIHPTHMSTPSSLYVPKGGTHGHGSASRLPRMPSNPLMSITQDWQGGKTSETATNTNAPTKTGGSRPLRRLRSAHTLGATTTTTTSSSNTSYYPGSRDIPAMPSLHSLHARFREQQQQPTAATRKEDARTYGNTTGTRKATSPIPPPPQTTTTTRHVSVPHAPTYQNQQHLAPTTTTTRPQLRKPSLNNLRNVSSSLHTFSSPSPTPPASAHHTQDTLSPAFQPQDAPPPRTLHKPLSMTRLRAKAPPPAAKNSATLYPHSVSPVPPTPTPMSIDQLLQQGPPPSVAAQSASHDDELAVAVRENDYQAGMDVLRREVLRQGIPATSDGLSSTRIYVWMVFLESPLVSTDDYLALIHRKASPAYAKIRNDTFRTLTTDPLFRRRVSEHSLIRLLNAIAWRLHDANAQQRQERERSTGLTSSSSTSKLPSRTMDDPTSTAPSSTPGQAETSEFYPQPQAMESRNTPVQLEEGATGSTSEEQGLFSQQVCSPAQQASPRETGGEEEFPVTVGTDEKRVMTVPRGRARARTLTTTDGSDRNLGVTAAVVDLGTYVQGMNVLAAPFLFAARSEVEAFSAFHTLLTRACPGYIRGAMEGVHRGLALVDRVMAFVDAPLHAHLTDKSLSAKLYAFPSVLTLSACTPPLPQVLRLWDFFFAYGPHLNIVAIVAQLHLMRDAILQSSAPSNLLRSLPALQADAIQKLTLAFVAQLPDALYEEIVVHAQ